MSVLCRGFFEKLMSLLNGGGGGLANADVIRGGGRSMLTVADRGEGGDKICQNLADVICERSHIKNTKNVT